MKLVRYGQPGEERAGLVDAQGDLRDLSALIPDVDKAAMKSAGWGRLCAWGLMKDPIRARWE
jgi:hypothetical protein